MTVQDSICRAATPRTTPLLLLMLCGVGAAVSTVCAAAPADDVPRIVIHYRADNLDTDSGARVVYRRLVQAAEDVCPAVPSGTLLVSSAIRECRAQAIDRAVRQVDSPRLATVHATSAKSS
jgi:UrcA family protein